MARAIIPIVIPGADGNLEQIGNIHLTDGPDNTTVVITEIENPNGATLNGLVESGAIEGRAFALIPVTPIE